jgi:sugar phosphate isomerase/epimerase
MHEAETKTSAVNRRHFLGALSAAAVFSGGSSAFAANRIETPGVQLYTVRDQLKADFNGTLAKVAAIGYREVELAGNHDRSPKEIRVSLDRVGLTSPGNHIDYKTVTSGMPAALDAAHVIGHKYLVNPWIDDEIRARPGGWHQAAEDFNRAGEAAQKAGIQFAYHNHFWEFRPLPDGRLPYDILLQECDAKLVKMELDICWITVGGQDPLKYFAKYPGRFPLVHVKGLSRLPKPANPTGQFTFEDVFPVMTDVGDGAIDWKRIFARAEQAGIQHYFVEHDQPKDPFQSIRSSFEYLKALRF